MLKRFQEPKILEPANGRKLSCTRIFSAIFIFIRCCRSWLDGLGAEQWEERKNQPGGRYGNMNKTTRDANPSH